MQINLNKLFNNLLYAEIYFGKINASNTWISNYALLHKLRHSYYYF